MKTILHIDIDAYFASAQQLKNPNLKNIPFAISNNINHGIISTSNYLARQYGVFSAMKNSEALKKCPQLKIIKAEMDYYKSLSDDFFKFIYKNITTNLEISSIDECYLDVSDLLNNFDDNVYLLCCEIKNKIKRKFNLDISIGCGPNKYIAKILTNLSKPNGLSIFDKNLFYQNKIFDLNHIHRDKLNSLNKLNIKTFKDFVDENNTTIISNIITKNRYYKIKNNLLNMNKSEELTLNYNKPNQISYTHHFDNYINDQLEIEIALKNAVKKLLNRKELKNYFYDTLIVYFKEQKKLKNYSMKINDYKNLEKITLEIFNKKWNDKEIKYIGFGLKNPNEISKQIDIYEFMNKKH